jgi:hypothetical protein
MNDESFINAANRIARIRAGLRDRMAELEEAYIEDNHVLEYGQRVWVNGKPYALTSIRLDRYKQYVNLTYTLRPHVEDWSRVSENWAAIELNSSYMGDWANVSVEKP